ncbi:MAG: efflux RND transporter periplasmic adaptor subunit [Deltaproteobacteria bacterium]|nr:efflux RND transporter periplasmic adaptor subunit [Deltaproteobacteria bacterium]
MMRSPRAVACAPAVALALSLGLAGCSNESASSKGSGGRGPGGPGGPGGGPLTFPVEVARVRTEVVQYAVTAVGSVEAYEKVQVTPRVTGVVERVRFKDGETVKAGQVLAEIEPARYRIAVASARASLQKAEASLADAKAGLARREKASAENPGLLRGEELDLYRTRTRTAEADVAQARAALDKAQLDLRDAYVRAPIGGVIETRTVQTGQYAKPEAILATLVRRDPLLLRFQVTDVEAARLRLGQTVRFKVRNLPALHAAKLTQVGQLADERSRMVAVTGEIAGPDQQELRPGAFAEVTAAVGGTREAPVIPQLAVRPSERGFLAYVVVGSKAVERVVQLGMRTAEGRVEVRSGLSAGELLVVRGAEALRNGAQVRVLAGEAAGGAPPAGGAGLARPEERAR